MRFSSCWLDTPEPLVGGVSGNGQRAHRLLLGTMVDMTAGRLPRAGQRDGVYYSTGHSGHGTRMVTLMSTSMAQIMDGRADHNPCKDFDWPAIPGHFGKPWFLPFVGAWYRLKDTLQ